MVKQCRFIFFSIVIFGFLPASGAQAALYQTDNFLGLGDKFKVYGDFRFRTEQDFDSERANSATARGNNRSRADRFRLRVRARLGANWEFNDHFSFDTRIRTGQNNSQQSPHITIVEHNGDNGRPGDRGNKGPADFNFDKYYLKAKGFGGELWGGRNDLTIWKQNELFWDDDVTVLGGGGRYTYAVTDNQSLQLNAIAAKLPAGMRDFAGEIYAGQVVYANKDLLSAFNVKDVNLTIASGYYSLEADPDAGGATSTGAAEDGLTGDFGLRDYRPIVSSVQLGTKVVGIPVQVGYDYIRNLETYKSSVSNHDDRDGWVAQAGLGQLKNPGDWLVFYYYARIEGRALNPAYAQDDWLRWGTTTQTNAVDFAGHEIRLGYVPFKQTNVMLRFYDVHAIDSGQDGNRVRLDLNYTF